MKTRPWCTSLISSYAVTLKTSASKTNPDSVRDRHTVVKTLCPARVDVRAQTLARVNEH